MDETTRRALLALSREFYRHRADSFDATRRRPWPGWRPLLPILGESAGGAAAPLRVLDAGCGNGRFARFLLERLGRPVDYLGVDSSEALLAAARGAGDPPDGPGAGSRLRFESAELGEWVAAPSAARFDLVALFGVLHHVPSRRHRRRLLAALAGRLTPGGRLVATWWLLHRGARLAKKQAPWSAAPHVDRSRLEAGDTLLRWQGAASPTADPNPAAAPPRYCHFPSPDELADLASLPGVELEREWRADGPGGEDNLYRLFRRPPAGGR